MKRMTSILLGLLLATDLCHADFSASGGINNAPYAFTPAAATGLEKVYVFNGFQNARLTFSDDQPADWTWYTYMQDPAEAEAVPASQVEVSATGTSVLGIQAGHASLSLVMLMALPPVIGTKNKSALVEASG